MNKEFADYYFNNTITENEIAKIKEMIALKYRDNCAKDKGVIGNIFGSWCQFHNINRSYFTVGGQYEIDLSISFPVFRVLYAGNYQNMSFETALKVVVQMAPSYEQACDFLFIVDKKWLKDMDAKRLACRDVLQDMYQRNLKYIYRYSFFVCEMKKRGYIFRY